MAQKSEDNLQFPPFIELLTIDSTNNYALNLLRQLHLTDRQLANLNGVTVFAHEQQQGKGQRGKKWESAPGENLQMSLIIDPQPLQLHRQFLITAITALAVCDFLAEKTEVDFFIKWPNDIYFQDRKAGGILIENIIAGSEWKWAVVGMGLNINQTSFDSSLPNPVSLKQITGRKFDCVELAKLLSERVLGVIAGYGLRDTGCGVPGGDLFDEYNARLYKRGEKVKLKKDSRVFEATIKQVAENGQLIVETGMEERFDFGEVVWVI